MAETYGTVLSETVEGGHSINEEGCERLGKNARVTHIVDFHSGGVLGIRNSMYMFVAKMIIWYGDDWADDMADANAPLPEAKNGPNIT